MLPGRMITWALISQQAESFYHAHGPFQLNLGGIAHYCYLPSMTAVTYSILTQFQGSPYPQNCLRTCRHLCSQNHNTPRKLPNWGGDVIILIWLTILAPASQNELEVQNVFVFTQFLSDCLRKYQKFHWQVCLSGIYIYIWERIRTNIGESTPRKNHWCHWKIVSLCFCGGWVIERLGKGTWTACKSILNKNPRSGCGRGGTWGWFLDDSKVLGEV
jgi:hypothetical protein